jgi:hypothetical protein
MGNAPDQAPEAAHEVALFDDHVSVAALPLLTVLGLALRLTVAAGFALTVTVADCDALPPAPVQVSMYVDVVVSAPVDWEPFVAMAPDQAPEAVHEVALFDVQVSVELLPLLMALGPTLKVTTGAAGLTETVTDCTALPPAPVQVRV